MAREIPISEQIQQLIRTGENARAVLGADIRTLKQKLDVPNRLRDSLRTHPTGWLGGSLVAGMAGSLLFRRKAKREKIKRKGVYGLLLSLLFTAIRPVAKVWLAGQLRNFVSSKFAQDELPSRPSRRVTPFYK